MPGNLCRQKMPKTLPNGAAIDKGRFRINFRTFSTSCFADEQGLRRWVSEPPPLPPSPQP